jgi:predicted hydrocarbon binding protein
MCLLDIETSFYHLRTSLEKAAGGVASFIFYGSGYKGGRAYGKAILDAGMVTKDEEGFRRSVWEYSEGGFGHFEVRSLDMGKGKAVIAGLDPAPFEAHAFMAHGELRPEPVCDFSRGVFAGLLSSLSDREDVACLEESCRAAGDPECVFWLDKDSVVQEAAVKASMRRWRKQAPPPAQG